MTAALWLRGMFQDEFGVKPTDIKWRTGGQEQPGREERMPVSIPGLDLKPIPEGATLSAMLQSGEIDALLSARTPSVYLRRVPNVDRMYPNYKEVEQTYFRKTGYFPIMHIVAIRSSLAERYPWLPASILQGAARVQGHRPGEAHQSRAACRRVAVDGVRVVRDQGADGQRLLALRRQGLPARDRRHDALRP